MKSLRIVFMGTPTFAVASLEAITKSHHQVVSVVTVPDKPSGRGQKLNESAVKLFAKEQNIPILQPEKLKNSDFIQALQRLQADVFVIVAFRILPKQVYTLPKLGTFNLHASLLPEFRGAAPINFAIIYGCKQTGVTTFFLDEKVDTGEILLQEKIAIDEEDNAGTLHDKLMNIGKELVLKTLEGIAENTLKAQKQNNNESMRYAPKIEKGFCKINWNDSPENLHNHIRGLSPYPCAFTEISIQNQPKILKIFKGKIINEKPDLPKFSIQLTKNECKIALDNVWYSLEEVQLEGKKRMNINEFLNGFQQEIQLVL